MSLTLSYGDDYYYTEEYKTIIRSCKEILLERATWVQFNDPSIGYAYRNNFHKFLRNIKLSESVGITEDMIWTISFINDMENPNKGFTDKTGIYFVSKDTIDTIIQVNRTQRQ